MPKEEKNKKGGEIRENEDDELEAKERLAKEEENFKIRSSASLTGPEAVAMFMIAFTLDAIGWLLLLFLLDPFQSLNRLKFLQ